MGDSENRKDPSSKGDDKMNINDEVEFHVTPDGRRILQESHIYVPESGYMKMQLWVWAQVFGEHMYNGGPTLFVDNTVTMVPKFPVRRGFGQGDPICALDDTPFSQGDPICKLR